MSVIVLIAVAGVGAVMVLGAGVAVLVYFLTRGTARRKTGDEDD